MLKPELKTLHSKHYAVILAGGSGTRLWPASRSECPKQFLDFFSTGQTQLQSTYERMCALLPRENVLVTTLEAYRPLVEQQLPGLPADNLLSESVARGTALSVCWAATRIKARCPEGVLVVVPSDQLITEPDLFHDDVAYALSFVERTNVLLTMGIVPTRPEPGYGYIQMGEEHPHDSGRTFWVKSFTEKPERQFAQIFMDSGEFLWNTGVVVATAETMCSCCAHLFPEYDCLECADVSQMWAQLPHMSLDRGVLERADNVCVLRCRFGWADLGSWHSVYESRHKVEGDNVVACGQAILDDCHGLVVHLPADHTAIINGLDDCIVVDTGQVLLICRRADSSQLIKKYRAEMSLRQQ